MKGTRPGNLPPPSRTRDREAICAHPSCATRLSVYNVGRYCWQHTEVVFPNYRGKRLRPDRS